MMFGFKQPKMSAFQSSLRLMLCLAIAVAPLSSNLGLAQSTNPTKKTTPISKDKLEKNDKEFNQALEDEVNGKFKWTDPKILFGATGLVAVAFTGSWCLMHRAACKYRMKRMSDGLGEFWNNITGKNKIGKIDTWEKRVQNHRKSIKKVKGIMTAKSYSESTKYAEVIDGTEISDKIIGRNSFVEKALDLLEREDFIMLQGKTGIGTTSIGKEMIRVQTKLALESGQAPSIPVWVDVTKLGTQGDDMYMAKIISKASGIFEQASEAATNPKTPVTIYLENVHDAKNLGASGKPGEKEKDAMAIIMNAIHDSKRNFKVVVISSDDNAPEVVEGLGRLDNLIVKVDEFSWASSDGSKWKRPEVAEMIETFFANRIRPEYSIFDIDLKDPASLENLVSLTDNHYKTLPEPSRTYTALNALIGEHYKVVGNAFDDKIGKNYRFQGEYESLNNMFGRNKKMSFKAVTDHYHQISQEIEFAEGRVKKARQAHNSKFLQKSLAELQNHQEQRRLLKQFLHNEIGVHTTLDADEIKQNIYRAKRIKPWLTFGDAAIAEENAKRHQEIAEIIIGQEKALKKAEKLSNQGLTEMLEPGREPGPASILAIFGEPGSGKSFFAKTKSRVYNQADGFPMVQIQADWRTEEKIMSEIVAQLKKHPNTSVLTIDEFDLLHPTAGKAFNSMISNGGFTFEGKYYDISNLELVLIGNTGWLNKEIGGWAGGQATEATMAYKEVQEFIRAKELEHARTLKHLKNLAENQGKSVKDLLTDPALVAIEDAILQKAQKHFDFMRYKYKDMFDNSAWDRMQKGVVEFMPILPKAKIELAKKAIKDKIDRKIKSQYRHLEGLELYDEKSLYELAAQLIDIGMDEVYNLNPRNITGNIVHSFLGDGLIDFARMQKGDNLNFRPTLQNAGNMTFNEISRLSQEAKDSFRALDTEHKRLESLIELVEEGTTMNADDLAEQYREITKVLSTEDIPRTPERFLENIDYWKKKSSSLAQEAKNADAKIAEFDAEYVRRLKQGDVSVKFVPVDAEPVAP